MHGRTRPAVLAILPAIAVAACTLQGVAQPIPQTFSGRVARLSEPGGDFDTDNLISNERSYLDVIPAVKAAGTSGGVYIGVGPDQNFSYIAHLRPSLAFIVDIRRDNLLLHLLFKSLFAAAQNRAEYLSLLTGRPLPEPASTWRDATLERIVASLDRTPAQSEASIGRLRERLNASVGAYGVPLDAADLATIERFHRTFINAGLSLKFESRGRPPRSVYPTFRDLLLVTDRAGKSWNYLASEDDFQFVRRMQAEDRIVPVVGDLGGTHALSAIGDLMMERGERLSAFYVSNVETYLYGEKYSQFARNVTRLPRDAHSLLIRAVFRASISSSEIQPVEDFAAAFRGR